MNLDNGCDLDLLLEKFTAYLRHERRNSECTVETYRRMLEQFFAAVKEEGMRSFVSPKPEELQSYLEGLRNRCRPAQRLKPRSIALHIDALRVLYRWLVANEYTTANAIRPVLDLEKPKLDDPVRTVLSPEQTKQLLEAPVMTSEQMQTLLDAPHRGLYRERDKAVLEVLYSTACRASELSNMRMEDLDLKAGTIRCKTKRGKERVLFLGRYAVASVILYLSGCRPRLVKNNPDCPFLFVQRGKSGGRLGRHSVHYVAKKYGELIGLGDRVTAHTFRRSAATHMLAAGADIRTLMDYLGHDSIKTTQVYLQLDPTALKECHASYHPHGAHGQPPATGTRKGRRLSDSVRWPDSLLTATGTQAGEAKQKFQGK